MKTDSRCDDSPMVRYFDGQAPGWTERYGHDGHFRDRLETVLHWLKDLPPESMVLDYGCGSGVLLVALAQAGHVVTGVDVSTAMLAWANRSLRSAGVPAEQVRLELANDDFQGGYLNQKYNAIVSLGVIEYLTNPMELLARLIDQLEPGGRLILSYPNRGSVLRKLERLVFHSPSLFRSLGIFPHLTTPDSYLNFQKHQFTTGEIQQLIAPHGLFLKRAHYHVTPKVLSTWEGRPLLGMTIIAEFLNPQG